MIKKLSSVFQIAYENDSVSSYLVLGLDAEEKIQEFQVEMIANNPHSGILPIDIRQKNNVVHIYYNITSKLSLRQFLQRRRLKRNELIHIFKRITDVLLLSKNYFISDKGFILSEEHIFINPATLETSLVYVPVAAGGDAIGEFKEFITGVIVRSAQIEDYDGDNFLQRILNALKREPFHLSNFDELLLALTNNEASSNGGREVSSEWAMEAEATKRNENQHRISSWAAEIKEEPIENLNASVKKQPLRPLSASDCFFIGKNQTEGSAKAKKVTGIHFIIGLVQVIAMVILLISFKHILPAVGENGITDPVSAGIVVFIVGAADFLVIRKLTDKKDSDGTNVSSEDLSDGRQQDDSRNHLSRRKVQMPQMKKPHFQVDKNVNQRKDNVVEKELHEIEMEISDGIGSVAATQERDELKDTYFEQPSAFYDDYTTETILLDSPPEDKTQACLKSVKGDMDERILINKPIFIVGRLAPQVDLASSNNAVGKVHAEIREAQGAYFLVDLNSRNGTFVNGNRISSNTEIPINHGDFITFANSEYLFEIG